MPPPLDPAVPPPPDLREAARRRPLPPPPPPDLSEATHLRPQPVDFNVPPPPDLSEAAPSREDQPPDAQPREEQPILIRKKRKRHQPVEEMKLGAAARDGGIKSRRRERSQEPEMRKKRHTNKVLHMKFSASVMFFRLYT